MLTLKNFSFSLLIIAFASFIPGAKANCPPGWVITEGGCKCLGTACGKHCCKKGEFCTKNKQCQKIGTVLPVCTNCPPGMTECVNNQCSYPRIFSIVIESTVDNTYCSVSDFPNKGSTPTRCFGTGPNAIGPINSGMRARASLPTNCLLHSKPVVTVLCSEGLQGGNIKCLNKLNPPINGKTYVYPQDFSTCTF